jgi:hypothetical protein
METQVMGAIPIPTEIIPAIQGEPAPEIEVVGDVAIIPPKELKPKK